MPPASRNHRVPTAGDTPALTAASSLECPVAIAAQNRRCFSCRRTEGRPGERSFARPARSERLLRVVIATPFGAVLRRPVELKYYAFVDMSGGSNDDACLAIAHREDDKLVLDLVQHQGTPPP